MSTVPSESNKIIHQGNGSNTVYAYDFRIDQDSDLQVYIIDLAAGTAVKQTLTTNYTVSGVKNASGGSIVFSVAPANGVYVLIYRDTDLTQLNQFPPNNRFPISVVAETVNKLAQGIQDLNEVVERCLKYDILDISSISSVLSKAARSSKFLSFNSNGEVSLKKVTPEEFTSGNLVDASHAANTADKYTGRIQINSTTGKLFYATGSDPTDDWVSADGLTTITPL